MPPHPLALRAAAGALGVACCIAGLSSLTADATGPTDAPTAPGTRPDAPPCSAVATPEVPPTPAPACTAAAPNPADGVVLDGVAYGVASEDDDVLVIDPACDGRLTLVVLRPDGDIFGFPHRPRDGTPVFGLPLAHADPGQILATDAGACPRPVLRRGLDAQTTAVPVAGLHQEATP